MVVVVLHAAMCSFIVSSAKGLRIFLSSLLVALQLECMQYVTFPFLSIIFFPFKNVQVVITVSSCL